MLQKNARIKIQVFVSMSIIINRDKHEISFPCLYYVARNLI